MNYNSLFVIENIPKALEKTQLYDYLLKTKAGDRKARDIVITHNVRLVLHKVKTRFSKTCYEERELIAIGIIGLIKSVDTFDITKKFEFSTYASRCIENEILMFLRKNNKYLDELGFDVSIDIDNKDNLIQFKNLMGDKTVDLISDYEIKESILELKKHFHILNDKEIKVFVLYYGLQYRQQEIADILNISRSYVSRLAKQAVIKIRKKLLEEEKIKEKNIKTKTIIETKKMIIRY